MAKWLLLDGFNLAFRSFYGMPELTRADGFPTGAVHGWLRTLWMLVDNERPDGVIVFYDLGGANRHEKLLPDYKAQRESCPEPLQQQIPLMKKIASSLGFYTVEKEGVEADDLIGAYAQYLAAKDHLVRVVSADKDFAQCIGGKVTQLLPPPTANPRLGWRNLDADGVVKKFGVPPEKIPDYLALIGDTSDNIPGLRGVGPKTAAKWLTQYGDLQTIIDHSGEIKPQRFRAIVHAEQKALHRNLQLTTLDLSLDVEKPEKIHPVPEELIDLLNSLEMKRAALDARQRYNLNDG